MKLTKLSHFALRYQKFVPAAFFVAGFIFDILTLGRVDAWSNIAQQAVYLCLIGVFIALELLEREALFAPGVRLLTVWKYREAWVHFLLGSLLSVYTLFYFKSASFFSSFVFLILIALLLVGNEFQRFRIFGARLRMVMLSLCMVSFFLILVPILLGWIGVVPFVLSIVASFLVCQLGFRLIKRRGLDQKTILRELIYPVCFIHILFTLLYFLRLLPPVPLAVTYMGVYHAVEKKDGQYILSHERPWWRIWHHGDQWFYARSGDIIYGYASIFSPAKFKDTIQVRWLLHSKTRGWETQDTIRLEITGGRDQGYRGYTAKKVFSPGFWRFQVETSDGREIGRLYFKVYEDPGVAPRAYRQDVF